MKTKTFFLTFLLCLACKLLNAQNYSVSDSTALINIDNVNDTSDVLNWDTETDPGAWDGVTWNTEDPKRAIALDLYGVAVTGEMNISELSSLSYFVCTRKYGLTGLITTGLTNLDTLDCAGNLITEMDVSDLENLTVLHCFRNELISLNATGLANLVNLNCFMNHLTDLDLTGLENLEFLHCGQNELTSIDFTPLVNLETLDCSRNKLPFSSLVTGLHVADYTYDRQDSLYEEQEYTENVELDYSAEAIIDGTPTNFAFYKNNELAESNSTGKYTTTGTGVYYCEMTNAKLPDLALVTSKVSVADGTSLKMTAYDNVSVFPNPFNAELNIHTGIYESLSYRLFDLSGKMILQGNITSEGKVQTVHLNKGMYLLELYDSGEKLILRQAMVKE